MAEKPRTIGLRDATLREGLDTPGVSFSSQQKLRIAASLDDAGVTEVEVVAPSRVLADLVFTRVLRDRIPGLVSSGLIYSHSPRARAEITAASESLHRFDLLMPVSERRAPFDPSTKLHLLVEILEFALSHHRNVGVGFPHSTQIDVEFLLEISRQSAVAGAERLTIYDTNGSADPFSVHSLITRLRAEVNVPIFFHGHNDLGMATANALAAVRAGADGLDVTVNGLGDRAGNTSLEQVAIALHLASYQTGLELGKLKAVSNLVEQESGVAVSKLAPVVGDFVVHHKSPSHLSDPGLFEAFDPAIVGKERSFEKS